MRGTSKDKASENKRHAANHGRTKEKKRKKSNKYARPHAFPPGRLAWWSNKLKADVPMSGKKVELGHRDEGKQDTRQKEGYNPASMQMRHWEDEGPGSAQEW